jgi:hypothetical protein
LISDRHVVAATPISRKSSAPSFRSLAPLQKVSNLILNINLYVCVVATRAPLVAMSVDIRGNTDESWSRGLEYLVRTRFLPPSMPNREQRSPLNSVCASIPTATP